MRWFAQNARDLPWRRTADPYAILVSEMMCQQTQVGTVLPYYERWLRRFPNFRALAAASEHDVLSLWQGLGYYSRARNLHRAAQAIAAGGAFPSALEEIRALPGVGRYTAGAVAAFAFDRPAALVDANIARVLARLFALRTPRPEEIWSHAESLQPARAGRAFNAGLMELGAIVCTPRKPRCSDCPVALWCRALATGEPEDFPAKKTRRRTVALAEPCLWIARDGQILLEHQAGARWRGLWKLPAAPAEPEHAPLLTLEYPFTHHRVTLSVHRGKPPRTLPKGHQWHPLATLEELPLAAAHRRALQQLQAQPAPAKRFAGRRRAVIVPPLSL